MQGQMRRLGILESARPPLGEPDVIPASVIMNTGVFSR